MALCLADGGQQLRLPSMGNRLLCQLWRLFSLRPHFVHHPYRYYRTTQTEFEEETSISVSLVPRCTVSTDPHFLVNLFHLICLL